MPKAERDREVMDFLMNKTRIIVSTWFVNPYLRAHATKLHADLVFLCGIPPKLKFFGPHGL
jgi:hypothetical protein